jgi:membrane protein YdbS with pleckstrin-like domain
LSKGPETLRVVSSGSTLAIGTAPSLGTNPDRLPPVDLQPGEKVIYEGHPSWRAIIGFYLKGILAAVILGVVVKLVASTGLGILVFVALVAITILAGFIKRIATVYVITDHRLNIKRGIVARKVQETRLQRVQNVNYTQGVYERIMQIGNVDFDTAGTDDSDFVFEGVAQPEQVVQQVERATPIISGLQGEAQQG